MIHVFNYESDALAERRGEEYCVPVTVELDISVTTDQEIEAHSYTIYVNGLELSQNGYRALEDEVEKQIDMEIDASMDTIYQNWAEHQMDAAAYHMEDR